MKLRRLILLVIFIAVNSQAQNRVITLNINHESTSITISPLLEFTLSEQIKEAIYNGIRVYFVVKIEMFQDNTWWFNKTVLNEKMELEVSYFTLSQLYVVKNRKTGKQLGFNNINQLKNKFEELISFSVETPKLTNLWVKMRLRLDKAALPTAMQLPVLFDSNWDVNTKWYKQRVQNK